MALETARTPISGQDPTATARAVMQVRMMVRAVLRTLSLALLPVAFVLAASTYPSYLKELQQAAVGFGLPPTPILSYFLTPVALTAAAVVLFLADLLALHWIVPVPGLRCPRCGYDIRGHTRGPCPECGLPLGELAPPPSSAAKVAE